MSPSERANGILPSSGLLRGIRWPETDVSGLSVPSSKVKLPLLLDSLTLEDGNRKVVLKRRFQTTLHRVITQKTEEFRSPATEVCDVAFV